MRTVSFLTGDWECLSVLVGTERSKLPGREIYLEDNIQLLHHMRKKTPSTKIEHVRKRILYYFSIINASTSIPFSTTNKNISFFLSHPALC